ncbi:MAG: protein kinase [Deltaproteobacteria bacterium]|nr:protein kinase [Deltaproteobacteria bacterium]
MREGDVVAGRFELERLAGSGGMGDVWRARDVETHAVVALKVMHAGAADERFAREARLLSELDHPGIVRYASHGTLDGGGRYLAMEWLEGEDLETRLRREPLSIRECLLTMERVASALGAAHARGVVHRDVKPSNLFLPGGDLDRVKLLDFGVARARITGIASTMSGAMIGTPAFMAPEQARGAPDVDARADVFALGCVLFECLVGRSPFAADHVLAVLSKIILEEAPRVSEVRADVPVALDDLVAKMLAKGREDRPSDGAAVAAALARIDCGEHATRSTALATVPPPALTRNEQRLLSVLLAASDRAGAVRAEVESAVTIDDLRPTTSDGEPAQERAGAAARVRRRPQSVIERVRAAADEHGGRAERLIDGSILVSLASEGVATDRAARAARCALAVRRVLPSVPMVLATGRADLSERLPVGDVVQRAARLLDAGSGCDGGVRIDDVTAGLLDARFDVGGDARGLCLRAERRTLGGARTLLGKPTPCVGRDPEIATLTALFDRCRDESIAHAVLVVGPAGIGKSRLRDELIGRVRDGRDPIEILVGRGDPMTTASPFGLVSQAIRGAAGLLEGEPSAVGQLKLAARVGRHVPERDRLRVTEFLGEIVGVPLPDEGRVELRAARADPLVMGDQMLRAWEDWVAAECRAQPVLVVLEDLHWGDPPSIRFVGAALRNLRDAPLMVLGLARPEIDERFADLWPALPVTRLPLGELSRRAAERFARDVLGSDASPETVERVATLAGGNAFYLEELVRAAVEGKGETLPETVSAMAQARIERLGDDERRVLRAASVLGRVFWGGAIRALLGGARRTAHVAPVLDGLIERELVVRRSVGRFAGEDEYVFRHALLREAAYAMLTDADRTLGHRLAGGWLVGAGESDPASIAEHFERGGEAAQAARWYRGAAEQALEGNDFAAVLAHAERAIACGASGEARATLRFLQQQAHYWRGENELTEARGLDAMNALPREHPLWYEAASHTATAARRLGRNERVCELCDELVSQLSAGGRSRGLLIAASRLSHPLLNAGEYARAARLMELVEAAAAAAETIEPGIAARVHAAHSVRALFAGDPGRYADLLEAATSEYERAGETRAACVQRGNRAYGLMELGDFAGAVDELRRVLETARRMGLEQVEATTKHNLGMALAQIGAIDEALEMERAAAETFAAQGDPRMEGASWTYLAAIAAMRGDLLAAEAHARHGVELLSGTPPLRPLSLATLARVLAESGRLDDALRAAEDAAATLASLGEIEVGEALVRLTHAERLHASGRHLEAARAIGVARDVLLARVAKIADARWRERYLRDVPEHARILALAASWSAG